MPNFNKVILAGHLTRDPESKFTPSGAKLAKGSLAVNNNYKDKKETGFFDFTVWGKLADVLTQYVKKGDPLLIEGSLKQERWEGKDGKKQSKITVNVSSFQMLGGKKSGGGSPASYGSGGNVDEINPADLGVDEFGQDDMPF